MKKIGILMASLLCVSALQAKTILSEDFETGNTGASPTPVTVGSGWTVVNGYTGAQSTFNWYNQYNNPNDTYSTAIQGPCCAAVTGPRYEGETEDGYDAREEVLLSPAITLDDTYQLQFSWAVSPESYPEYTRYDLQVRVVTDGNLKGAETIFSVLDEKMLRESGVTEYPIRDWDAHTSRIDLSDFQGETIQLAFVYKTYAHTSNEARIDAVTVSSFTPAASPVASLSADRLTFSNVYFGEKRYSDVITLTNTGKNGLTISSIDMPEGVSLTLDPATVNLDTYKSVNFRVLYTGSATAATTGNIVFHTNGGDKQIAITATKQFVPEGMTMETFEEYFPPAGWSNNGWGRSSSTTLEGDYSAFSDGGYTDQTLTSPLLDLSKETTLSFRYTAVFASDDPDAAPEYDVELQTSSDNGESWKKVWTCDYQTVNTLQDIEVNLNGGSGRDLVRWVYPAIEVDDEGALPHYTFYMDYVMLPNVVGKDGVPTAASNPTPADGTDRLIPNNIKLSWAPAQFAEGYKLYVGSNDAGNNLVNGLDLGNQRTYTIATCDYETTYKWKVVAYNAKGDCTDAPTWTFTTQPNAAVTNYPYVEDFMDGFPDGWVNIPSGAQSYFKKWDINSIYPYVYDNKRYNVLYNGWLEPGDQCILESPEFRLPVGEASSISFIWGDEHPSDMLVDPTGLGPKNNVEPNNGKSITYFEIFTNGEWKELSHLSDNYIADNPDKKYWVNEFIDLSDYQGQTVKFRWRNVSLSSSHNGGSLTHIVVDAKNDNRAELNLSSWEAGKVNCDKSVKSGKIFTIVNNGRVAQKIAKVETNTANFSSTLAEGDEIAPATVKGFEVIFAAQKSGVGVAEKKIDDMLTITMESGLTLRLPVSGTALPETTYYYSFEPNDDELNWENDFTMIDADGGYSYSFGGNAMYYPLDNKKGAFCVAYDGEEDGLWSTMYPVSGMHALVAPCPQNGKADNWLISKKLKISADSKMNFYARNLDFDGEYETEPNHLLTILVSRADNENTGDFEVIREAEEIPLKTHKQWNYYSIDLSRFDGEDVHVAIRHTTDQVSNVAFLDDVEFTNVQAGANGVDGLDTAISNDAYVEVFSVSGMKVADGFGADVLGNLGKGCYIVRISDRGNIRTLNIIK